MTEKFTQSSQSKGVKHCGNCIHFRMKDTRAGYCQMWGRSVSSFDSYCRAYEKQPKVG